jgi:hypothetical protein
MKSLPVAIAGPFGNLFQVGRRHLLPVGKRRVPQTLVCWYDRDPDGRGLGCLVNEHNFLLIQAVESPKVLFFISEYRAEGMLGASGGFYHSNAGKDLLRW